MSSTNPNERRAVQVQTPAGSVSGNLAVAPSLRTLDDLNFISKAFVLLHEAESSATGWNLPEGPMAINKSTILFVVEDRPIERGPARTLVQQATDRVTLRVGDYLLEGSVTFPAGGTALTSLDAAAHPFVALTDTRIQGPGGEQRASFVAVNRRHVTAATAASMGEVADDLDAAAG
ncbi:hypothetical protein ABI59_23150 [Acidobacteria bacterium Mor1]|nr:hypothetical protein ABI59_23150 [Acidobacteria bacterium Mor1]